jgi:signal transduction histidine kinase
VWNSGRGSAPRSEGSPDWIRARSAVLALPSSPGLVLIPSRSRYSRAKIVLITQATAPGSAVVMTVEADGVGLPARGRVPARSFGLPAMREKMEALGGRFRRESRPALSGRRGWGTRIEVSLPPPGYRL